MFRLQLRFTLAFLVILLFNITGAAVVAMTILGQTDDALIINKAGAQRMLCQRMAKEALQLRATGTGAEELSATHAAFDDTLKGLLSGSAALRLPAAEDPQLRERLVKVQDIWSAVGPAVLQLAQPAQTATPTGNDPLNVIISRNMELLEAMNAAVSRYEAMSAAGLQRLAYVQGGVLLAVIVCVLWLWLGSVRRLTGRLETLIADASQNSDTLSRISAQISSAGNDLSNGSNSQAASLEETSAALEEMASMTRQNADNTIKANELATQMLTEAQNGDESMRRLGHAVREITESSSEIGKIIKVIEEIAFQTNLLALNAAVEAARAGDAGKGFAVVADEVRNLAHRSSTAAKETNALIDRAVQRAQNGSSIAEATSAQLTIICAKVKDVNSIISEITSANNEQAQGVEQVNTAVSSMDRITQSNAALAEETASAAEELANQAQELTRMVHNLSELVHGTGSADSAQQLGRAVGARPAKAPAGLLVAPSGAASAEFVPWTPAMSTGVEEMDQEHKVLFRLINQLHASLKDGSDKSVMGHILQELTDYTDTHFSDEEELLGAIGYPKLHQQQKLHREFVSKLNELIEGQKAGKMMLGLDALQFLKKWLTVHIQQVDHEYGPYVQSHTRR